MNDRRQGIFAPVDRIHVSGGAGADRVDAAGVGVPIRVEGGDGDDIVVGTRGDDVLLGGAGNDRLAGGGGRDLVVGGTGEDRLSGGPGDDVLVAGEIGGGIVPGQVMELWAEDADYATRVARITSSDFGAVFIPGATADDSAMDVLAGRSGTDLFFARIQGDAGLPLDRVRPLARAEVLVAS